MLESIWNTETLNNPFDIFCYFGFSLEHFQAPSVSCPLYTWKLKSTEALQISVTNI